MGEPQVSDAEKERLLAEIGVEPSSVVLRPASGTRLRPVSSTSFPAVAPASSSRLQAVRPVDPPEEPAPRAPSKFWAERRLISALIMLAAGSAWIAMWMVSERPSAAGLAALGIAAGGWVALRPKKA